MSRFFTSTFYKFFFGFVLIISAALCVMMVATAVLGEPESIDNAAHPE